ncbi:hypothetical protein FG379_003601 [Cryptosporidium bovis]|uniref:uncharacterized protein n=1 Tax=Cryptosporidium bovis TaxID=310047 RepID=UPI003519DA69|nr:hypothetical protein FG379_003601 [Cryptosporidium bovis]
MNSNINLKCTDLVPSICFDLSGGSGFHNSCIGVFLIVFFGWVTYRVSQILELYEIIRIMEEEKKIVYLPSLGPFSNELKRLMRVHLSQIIKEKCSMSPIQIRKISVLCAIDEATIKTKLIQNSSSSSNPEQSYSLDVSFNVDSELPFSVEMFWGVKYSDVKKLLSGSAEMNENDAVLPSSNLKTRRKAVGSSISLYNQIKRSGNHTSEGSECGCKYECDCRLNDYCGNSEFNTSNSSLFEGDFDSENNHKHICDCKNEYRHKNSENIGYLNDSLIENGRYETNRTGLEKNGNSSENKYNNIDFSPSNSLINLAQVNPLLYTSIQSNNNSNSFGYYQRTNNNNIGERYANFLKNINFDIKRNVMDRIRNNINNNQLFFNSSSGNSNSRWNGSLLGENTVVLSRAIKRILNRLFYRLNNVNDTTTESLLEMSSQIGVNNSRFTNVDVKYRNENITNVNHYKDNIYLNANGDNGVYRLDSIFKGKVTKYDKGLSQIHSERIKLTMDYINSCNLLSPYCNYEDNQETINNGLYFDHNNINNGDRIPLLVLIKTNINEYDVDLHNRIMSNNNFRESLTLSNVVLIHFELIQDHYNIPYILYKPIIVEQYYLNFNNCLIEPSDTFGLEDDEFDCLICMSNPKNSVLLPCKHCILCESCLRSLRQDKCPLCRTTFYGFVVLPVNSNISVNS